MTYRTTKRQNWPRVPRKSLELTQYEGFTLVSLVALEVTEPLVVTCCGERLTIMDIGYRWLTLCEPGARHVTTVQPAGAGGHYRIRRTELERLLQPVRSQ